MDAGLGRRKRALVFAGASALLLPFVSACGRARHPDAHVAPHVAVNGSTAIEPRFAQDFEQPRRGQGTQDPSDYRVHVYAERDGTPLELFVFPARPAQPSGNAAVLLFHSGGWTRGRPEWLFGLAKRFSGLGLVAIPVQYRLSRDGVTPLDALDDACAAFRWVRQHAGELKLDPRRVAGWGASAGGQLVATAATAGCRVGANGGAPDALILVSAGIHLEQSTQFRKLVGDSLDVSRYSATSNVKRGAPPTLYVAGAEDTVTPLASAESFCSKLQAVHSICRLVSFPRLGHLLTRQLDDQRTRLDPDQDAEQRAYLAEENFLRELGYVSVAAER